MWPRSTTRTDALRLKIENTPQYLNEQQAQLTQITVYSNIEKIENTDIILIRRYVLTVAEGYPQNSSVLPEQLLFTVVLCRFRCPRNECKTMKF